MNEPIDTEGRRALNERLAAPKRSQSWLSRLLNLTGMEVAQVSVSAWCRGESRPEADVRMLLSILLEIPEHAWLTDAERRFMRAARDLRAAVDTLTGGESTAPDHVTQAA